jgi:4-carboxymuconolactone decarboxylase
MTPRIPPVPPEQLDDDGRALLSSVDTQGTGANNVFRTLVRHKGLFRHFIPYGGKLLRGKLPARQRELIILRVAHLCRSPYEWSQHATLAASIGLTTDEIAAVQRGSTADGWSTVDEAVLRAVEELQTRSTISPATWEALAEHFDEAQLIELPLLVGHFQGVAYLLNSLEVALEEPTGPTATTGAGRP